MKRLAITAFLMLTLFSKAEMLDVDYNFIDTAFDGIQPITNKEFDDTINRLTPQPVDDSFGGRLKTFLFGRKYGVEPTPKGQDKEMDIGGETKAIQEIKNGIYYIKLLVTIITPDNTVIPMGNYKVQEKIIDNQEMLVFYQGHNEYGKLKLKKFEDNLKGENDITYSRVDIIDENTIRVVYSTISDTKCAIAKVYNQN